MDDFLLWVLIIALSCTKLVLYAALIALCWVLIKKYGPDTANTIKDNIPKFNQKENK